MSGANQYGYVQPYSDETKAKARQMRAQGKGYREIGRALGISETTARKWTDETYHERRNASENRRRAEAKKDHPFANVVYKHLRAVDGVNMTPEELEARKPRPHHSITAIMFGDPAPGRSALDQRANA